jgi:lysophospholipase
MPDAAPLHLEERFLQPEGWKWETFRSQAHGFDVRFGYAYPKGAIPDAVVVCLPGLSEFSEKYFETARDLLARNLAFWVVDWPGQGLSSRHLGTKQKRHSAGFESEVDILHELYTNHISPLNRYPDSGKRPLVMGGNLGVRYLAQHPDTFRFAFFSSPFWGLKAVAGYPPALPTYAAQLVSTLAGQCYAPGMKEWDETHRAPEAVEDEFSSDPVRSAVHNAWYLATPDLQVGGVTWRWLYEALKSSRIIQSDGFAQNLKTPFYAALAGRDTLVDNSVTKALASQLSDVMLIEFPDAKHELLMETDDVRSAVLDNFYDGIERYAL